MSDAASYTVAYSAEFLLRLVRGTYQVVENPVPEDAELYGIDVDHERNEIRLTFGSETGHNGNAPTIRDLEATAPEELAALRIENTDLRAQLAEFDAALATDARIWDGVRDQVNAYLLDQHGDVSTAERLALMIVANQVTAIALGERVEAVEDTPGERKWSVGGGCGCGLASIGECDGSCEEEGRNG